MKISASVYADQRKDLVATVRDLEAHGADMLHIDCHGEPKIFEDIRTVRSITELPIDLHLIVPRPQLFGDLLRHTPVDYLTIQYETLASDAELPTQGHRHLGMAFSEGTEPAAFSPFANQCDFVLIMATTPGVSGGVFQTTSFRTVREFARLYPGRRLHVDGGVNAEVSFILRNMGVWCAVSGSYLFKEATLGGAMLKLKSGMTESHFCVRDFMRTMDETPHLRTEDITTERILRSIEDKRLGFTLIVDRHGTLTGMASNADLRRGMLNHINDLRALSPEHLINRNPIAVSEKLTVKELLSHIRRQPIPINYLPVTDDKGVLVGCLTFNDLIKGEA
jgi:pentose-5-phosphate-3-epimerase/CBS domain-containing protein